MFQSGLTNQFYFAYISKRNEGDNKRKVDSRSEKYVGPPDIHHIQGGDLEIEDPILNV